MVSKIMINIFESNELDEKVVCREFRHTTKQGAIESERQKEATISILETVQNYGYMGLYGGLGQKEIHQKKGLKKSQKILDHMGSEELAANLFRATQAEAKLRRENIYGEQKANLAHHEVGKKVRQTIKEIGGTMPEELPPTDGVNKAQTRIKQAGRKSLGAKNEKR